MLTKKTRDFTQSQLPPDVCFVGLCAHTYATANKVESSTWSSLKGRYIRMHVFTCCSCICVWNMAWTGFCVCPYLCCESNWMNSLPLPLRPPPQPCCKELHRYCFSHADFWVWEEEGCEGKSRDKIKALLSPDQAWAHPGFKEFAWMSDLWPVVVGRFLTFSPCVFESQTISSHINKPWHERDDWDTSYSLLHGIICLFRERGTGKSRKREDLSLQCNKMGWCS